jgi:hypothetical protein
VAKSKVVTREQAEAMKAKAGDFLERIGDADRAAEFDAMSIDDYAQHKGLTLSNPPRQSIGRETKMARSSGPSKTDLQDQLDEINDILSDAYDPESSREDMAAAIGQALDTLNGEEDEDDDSSPDSDYDEDRD